GAPGGARPAPRPPAPGPGGPRRDAHHVSAEARPPAWDAARNTPYPFPVDVTTTKRALSSGGVRATGWLFPVCSYGNRRAGLRSPRRRGGRAAHLARGRSAPAPSVDRVGPRRRARARVCARAGTARVRVARALEARPRRDRRQPRARRAGRPRHGPPSARRRRALAAGRPPRRRAGPRLRARRRAVPAYGTRAPS